MSRGRLGKGDLLKHTLTLGSACLAAPVTSPYVALNLQQVIFPSLQPLGQCLNLLGGTCIACLMLLFFRLCGKVSFFFLSLFKRERERVHMRERMS